MAGRVIGIVGASGAGKDTLMQAMQSAMPSLQLAKRVITRPIGAGGEDFDGVSEEEFLVQENSGDLALSWQAHGLRYGIPKSSLAGVANGQTVLVNLSRRVLEEAATVFPNFTVLNVVASPETLAKRLAQRGRESESAIAARLRREVDDFPTHLRVITIENDGTIAAACDAALDALQSESV